MGRRFWSSRQSACLKLWKCVKVWKSVKVWRRPRRCPALILKAAACLKAAVSQRQAIDSFKKSRDRTKVLLCYTNCGFVLTEKLVGPMPSNGNVVHNENSAHHAYKPMLNLDLWLSVERSGIWKSGNLEILKLTDWFCLLHPETAAWSSMFNATLFANWTIGETPASWAKC